MTMVVSNCFESEPGGTRTPNQTVMSVGQSTRLPGNARLSCNLGEDSSLLVRVFLGGSWGLPA